MQTHPINARKHLILFTLAWRTKSMAEKQIKFQFQANKKTTFFCAHAIDLSSVERFFTPAHSVNGNLYSIFGFLNYS